MNRKLLVLLLVLLPAIVFAQQNTQAKFALVMGNGNYVGLSKLANPVNDANDVAAALTSLGFSVDKVLNGSLDQMENGVIKFKNRLAVNSDSYGFLFYAGHGVQAGGENYIIPVDANIPSESYLRTRAVSVQAMLDDLNNAGNALNVVVLDACRDNPFGWGRSGTRGLTVVGRQPTDSIIVYATSAGQQASDGTGRNGLFTSQFLPNLTTPGIDVNEVFKRTGADVAEASGNKQIPAIYSQFFKTAYLGEKPEGTASLPARPAQPATVPYSPGKASGGRDDSKLWALGASIGSSFDAPMLIGTVHGTLAPFKNMFVEVGFDVGMINPDNRVAGYYSLCPYANFAYFKPLASKFGVYAGGGGGAWMVSYQFTEYDNYFKPHVMAALTAGFILIDSVDVSYTMRTNFIGFSHKASVGYVYRF